ncbi:MAG TPA: GAP family protein [Candidatus Limnocylindrales bacterium]|nr:GAP family protein [Candidatus Limnocylindrales bacterium]
MLNLLLLLIPIAIVDSFNPTAIAAIIVLLATPKPVPRVVAAILGFAFAYFVFGVLVVLGAGSLMAQIGAWLSNPPPLFYGLQLALAGGLFYYFFRQRRAQQPRAVETEPSASVRWAATPLAAFVLGAALNASELPTAFPYLAALERIAASQVLATEAIVALVLYAFIFVRPMLFILGLYLRLHERAAPLITRVSGGVERWSGRLLAWGALALGVGILADSLVFFVRGDGLF